MNVIARFLGFASSEPPPPRDRLRAALAARDNAQRELATATEACERVESVIESVQLADRRTRDAEQAAAESAKRWAAAGANPNDRDEHERLRDAIAVAERAAGKCWFAANGAKAGLDKVKATESACATALGNALDEIRESIGAIFVNEIAPEIERLEVATREYESARLAVTSVYRVVSAARPGWADDRTHVSNEAAKIIRAAMERCAIRPLAEREMRNGFPVPNTHTPQAVLERTALWRALAEKLRTDPDAQLL
jgi:hypothetical protein